MKSKKSERVTYDRQVVGLRLKKNRKQMGLTRGYVAEQIGIVEKYYADIERGACGMSIETMLALAQLYHISLDEFIYGEEKHPESETESLEARMKELSPQEKEYYAGLMYLFIEGIKEKV